MELMLLLRNHLERFMPLRSTQGAAKSQRNSQEDDVSMMERELLGVLPDLPFKDDELLGMISSELKQGLNFLL